MSDHSHAGRLAYEFEVILPHLKEVGESLSIIHTAVRVIVRPDPVRAKEIVVQALQAAELLDYLAESYRAVADNFAIMDGQPFETVGVGRRAADVAGDLGVGLFEELSPGKALPDMLTENLDLRRSLSGENRREEYERCLADHQAKAADPLGAILKALGGVLAEAPSS